MDAISQIDSAGLIFAGVIFIGLITLIKPFIEAAVKNRSNQNGADGNKAILQSMARMEKVLMMDEGVHSHDLMKKDISDILNKVYGLERAILGNGAPGIKTRLALVEHKISNLEEENV